MYKFCVIEYERRQSELILPAQTVDILPVKSVWNILYTVEFNPNDEEEMNLATQACQAWVEQNKAPGSKYVIMEMFFVE